MSQSVYWAGDSTVKSNNFTTYPQTGMGQAMGLYFKEAITIHNYAENGRSSLSFIDEGSLATIYNKIGKDDFLFIQFGHNDAKVEDPKRFTEPFGSYQVNLEKFINVARNRGAHPILITPVCRRWFLEDGTLDEDIHGDYPEAMIDLANRLEVPVINLYATSREMIRSMGPINSKAYFVTTDNTHLVYPGAVSFAGFIAKGLKKLGGIYSQLLIHPEMI